MSDFADFSNSLTDEQRLLLIKQGDPRMNDAQAIEYLSVMEERFDKKQDLLERGFSNALAEKFLDRQGWPRPFGWSSVFCYPGSNRLRNRYLVVIAVAGLIIGWTLMSNA